MVVMTYVEAVRDLSGPQRDRVAEEETAARAIFGDPCGCLSSVRSSIWPV